MTSPASPVADSSHPEPDDAARLAAVMARAPVALGFTKGDRFTAASEQFNNLFGFGEEHDARDLPARQLFVSDAAFVGLRDRLAAAFDAGRPLDEEIECVRRDGSRLWARLQASPLGWDTPRAEAMWIFQDVTAARQQRMQPTWAARHDPVTELANRREFERRLSAHVGSRRHEPVSVLWIDLDRFRNVVEIEGLEVTNHFLRSLGQMLITKVRASDPVARMEADHFAVLLPDCDQHYAEIVAEKIRAAIFTFRMRWGQHRSRIQASIGVVQLQPHLDTVELALQAASDACAQAKAAGGDTVRVYVSPEPAPGAD
jgi:diguanylate cyclase (GGDEF)-like protein/PAS domain S-box-containing protein